MAVTFLISWHVMWYCNVCNCWCTLLYYIHHSIELYTIWCGDMIAHHRLWFAWALHVYHIKWYWNSITLCILLCRVLDWIYVTSYKVLLLHIIGCHILRSYGMPCGFLTSILIFYGIVHYSGISLLIISFGMIEYHVVS